MPEFHYCSPVISAKFRRLKLVHADFGYKQHTMSNKKRCHLKEATEEDTEGKQFRGAFESVFKKASMRDLQQD